MRKWLIVGLFVLVASCTGVIIKKHIEPSGYTEKDIVVPMDGTSVKVHISEYYGEKYYFHLLKGRDTTVVEVDSTTFAKLQEGMKY